MAATSKVNERITEIKSGIAAKVAEQDTIVDSVEDDANGAMILTPEKKAAFSTSVNEAKALREELELLEKSAEIGDWTRETPGSKAIEVAAVHEIMEKAGFTSRDATRAAMSVGQQFVLSDEFKALGGGRNGVFMQVPFEAKDIYSDTPTGTPGIFGTVTREAPVAQPHRKIRMRTLLSVVKTQSLIIEYFAQDTFVNAASVVPQRNVANNAYGQKPQTDLNWTGHQASMKTIAHYALVHRNTLADEPIMANFIDQQLLYGLQLAEDNQILNGAGTSEDLLGILNTPGIQSNDASGQPGTDQNADTVRKSITKVFLANLEPDSIVMHPTDWQNIELIKDTQNRYIVTTAVADGAPPRLWSLDVLATPAMTLHTALVGSFQYGATLYDREEANIRTAEQHSDLFTKNAVAVLAEERVALAVHLPAAFVKTTLA